MNLKPRSSPAIVIWKVAVTMPLVGSEVRGAGRGSAIVAVFSGRPQAVPAVKNSSRVSVR